MFESVVCFLSNYYDLNCLDPFRIELELKMVRNRGSIISITRYYYLFWLEGLGNHIQSILSGLFRWDTPHDNYLIIYCRFCIEIFSENP